jgi:hypothetical protein
MNVGIVLSLIFVTLTLVGVLVWYFFFYNKKEAVSTASLQTENLFVEKFPKKIQNIYVPNENLYSFKNKVKTIDLKSKSFDIVIPEDIEDFTYQISGEINNAKMDFYDSEKQMVGSISLIKIPGKEVLLLSHQNKYGEIEQEVKINNENLINITFRNGVLIANKTSFLFSTYNIKYVKILGEDFKKLLFLGMKSGREV